MPALFRSQAFATFAEIDMPTMVQICHIAMKESFANAADDIFIDGVECGTMRQLAKGSGEYISMERGDMEVHKDVAQQWLSEVATWVKWVHAGQLVARSMVSLVELDTATFRWVLTRA